MDNNEHKMKRGLKSRHMQMIALGASVAGYGVIMLLSYWMGQKKYPIQYDLKSLGLYILLAAVLYVIGEQVPISDLVLRLAFRTVLLLLFVAYIVKKDLPLSQLPVINRFIKKK